MAREMIPVPRWLAKFMDAPESVRRALARYLRDHPVDFEFAVVPCALCGDTRAVKEGQKLPPKFCSPECQSLDNLKEIRKCDGLRKKLGRLLSKSQIDRDALRLLEKEFRQAASLQR